MWISTQQVNLLTYLLTYLLTPRCRVLLDKLTDLQLVKKLPTFHGTRTFITALTSLRQLSLSWASPIQSIYPHPTSWRSILILSAHLRLGLPSGSFPTVSPPRPYTPPVLTHTRYMPSPSNSSRFYHSYNTGWGVQQHVNYCSYILHSSNTWEKMWIQWGSVSAVYRLQKQPMIHLTGKSCIILSLSSVYTWSYCG